MRAFSRILLSLILLALQYSANSQFVKDSTCTGTLSGVVWDSAYNYALQSATIAVYLAKDSTLVNYQLSNNFGEFNFKELPTGVELSVVASFVGYKAAIKKLKIKSADNSLDLKRVYMYRKGEAEQENTGLEDVIVKAIPPVQMNGDTLEFNADAFNLDPNAVTEDLLRKLPGVVVWGDGTITVNGKEVNSVLVNGKPFFGGDPRIATQNLPKLVVDKIQVYQQSKGQNNPFDSTTEINIKLKKNKGFGSFGKVAAGIGTDKHYEADANINFYNNQTQFGVVGAINDINKIAMDVNTLMRNSTFKGVGANIEYQPDFDMSGVNISRSGGFTYQHDFIDHPDYYRSNRLQSNYFVRNSNGKNNSTTDQITSLGADSTQSCHTISQNNSNFTAQKFHTNYDKKKNDYAFSAGLDLNSSLTDDRNASKSSLSSSYGGGSQNDNQNKTHSVAQDLSLSTSLRHNNNQLKKGMFKNDWNINYGLSLSKNDNDNLKRTQFINLADSTQNQYVDRLYDNASNSMSQYLQMELGGISNLILPRGIRFFGTKITNSLVFSSKHETNLVQDKNAYEGSYVNNDYLSVKSHYTALDEKPGITLSKSLFKSLANRYNKNISFILQTEEQFYYKKNSSDHEFQNITQNYKNFLPSASISAQNNQFGAFRDIYNLRFETTAQIPDLYQLVPLVDSSNLYYIRRGNLNLRPGYIKSLNFSFRHNSYSSKNQFNYNFSISASKTSQAIADSSATDSIGRSTYYAVNLDGYQALSANVSLEKEIKIKDHQFQISYSGYINLSRSPSYINGLFNYSKGLLTNQSISINYNLSDQLAIDLMQSYESYRSAQQGATNNVFTNGISKTRLSTSIKCTKKLTVGSNITYNHGTSSAASPTNFTIWNAQAYYRFLKGNNLELKLAALDLLHQNTSIINFGRNNIITHGTNQVLQNYYMVTVSFYPRKFGKKEQK